jgi:hypothetical protein
MVKRLGGRKWSEEQYGQNKAVSFTKARVKEWIRYYFEDQLIPEESSFKYLGIIKCSGQIM